DVIEPSTEGLITRIPMGTTQDLDRAVQAARAQFDGGAWRQAKPAERERMRHRSADVIENSAAELAKTESIDSGVRCPGTGCRYPGYGRYSALFRRLGDEAPWAYRRAIVTGQLPGLYTQGAGRGCRRHRALELPVANHGLEARCCPGNRLHPGGQT